MKVDLPDDVLAGLDRHAAELCLARVPFVRALLAAVAFDRGPVLRLRAVLVIDEDAVGVAAPAARADNP